jgi:hypothetical protein
VEDAEYSSPFIFEFIDFPIKRQSSNKEAIIRTSLRRSKEAIIRTSLRRSKEAIMTHENLRIEKKEPSIHMSFLVLLMPATASRKTLLVPGYRVNHKEAIMKKALQPLARVPALAAT